jgi:CRISPR-associated protein Cst2
MDTLIIWTSIPMAMTDMKLSHITGTFVMDAMPSFLNGAGISKSKEDKNYTILKTFRDGVGRVEAELEGGPQRITNYRTVFVSSQSFRRMLRDTMIEETGWKPSLMRAYAQNKSGNTSKAGGAIDPVTYAEDDLFGYMHTREGSGKPVVVAITSPNGTSNQGANGTVPVITEITTDDEEDSEGERVTSITRTSPLSTSILIGLRKDAWQGRDDAFVHLTEGTPLPYSLQFANTPFTGIFTLNYNRLCRFSNVGDRIELDDKLVDLYLKNNTIKQLSDKPEYYSLETKEEDVVISKGKKKGQTKKGKVSRTTPEFGKIYELVNAAQIRKERASALINSLAVLRGGAKQAAFHTDPSPKVIIMAGLSCGNPIFNTLFQDDNSLNARGKTVSIEVGALKDIVDNYRDRIVTKVYVGIRTGFLKNEDQVRNELTKEEGFEVTRIRDAAKQLTDSLPSA